MSAHQKHIGLRVVIVAVVAAVLVLGGIGITGAAAQSSIPGDALYSVKTSIEQTRLSLARDAGNRAQMKMAFAEERLNEINALIQEGRFREVAPAVLAFEANINSAILELETLAKADPARAGQLALEITATLSRYAQTLSDLVAQVPDSVRSEVNRALDTTRVVGGLEMSFGDDDSNDNDDDNSNSNSNDSNSNSNGNDDDEDDDSNSNSNDNGDDDSNSNSNSNDDNEDDDSNSNSNDNGDDDSNSNLNGNDDDEDDDSNSNGNDDNGDDDSNSNSNDDDGDDDSNSNGNDDGEDDDSNSNNNDDDGEDDSNSNSNDDEDDDLDSGGDDNDNGNDYDD